MDVSRRPKGRDEVATALIDEKEPTLWEFAKVVRNLEERELEAGGLN